MTRTSRSQGTSNTPIRIRQADRSVLIDALENAGFTRVGDGVSLNRETLMRELALMQGSERIIIGETTINLSIERPPTEGSYHVTVTVSYSHDDGTTPYAVGSRQPFIELEHMMPGKALYANTSDHAPPGFMAMLSPANLTALESGMMDEPVSAMRIGRIDLEKLEVKSSGAGITLEHRAETQMKGVLVFSRIFGGAETFVREMINAAAFVVKAVRNAIDPEGDSEDANNQMTIASGLIADKR